MRVLTCVVRAGSEKVLAIERWRTAPTRHGLQEKLAVRLRGGRGTAIEERSGLQVLNYMRGEGDLEGRGAPLV